jgi:hypothetical protein
MISESVVRDLGHGPRLLARNPASTLLTVVALAAGIGINTAVYTGYKAMVARPLDAHDPSTMVNLALKRGPGGAQWSFSYPDYEMLRDSMHSLSGLVAYRPAQLTISARALGDGAASMLGRLAMLQNNSTGSAEFASVFVVSANYFRVLGVGLLRGRDFESYRREEFLRNPVVLLSENYWRKRFSRDPAVVGRTVFLNSVGVVIAGITPHDFCGTSIGAPAFWAPVDIEPLLHSDEQFLRDREAQRYRLLGGWRGTPASRRRKRS